MYKARWYAAKSRGDRVAGTSVPLIAVAVRASQACKAQGDLLLYVLVGADGAAKSVTAFGSPHPN